MESTRGSLKATKPKKPMAPIFFILQLANAILLLPDAAFEHIDHSQLNTSNMLRRELLTQSLKTIQNEHAPSLVYFNAITKHIDGGEARKDALVLELYKLSTTRQ